MQKRNEEAFADIQGANVIADDLFIAARNEIEHDVIMHNVLQRARREIWFKVTTVTYMGNSVTEDGMRPDPDKIEAIVNMLKPTDKHGLLRLFGMHKYLSQYIPNESSITAPLRSPLKRYMELSLQYEHHAAMDDIQKKLARDTVLAFYDVRKSATIQADASQSGLGCGLMQPGRSVAYSSRALTDVEQNYSQIEKEMLAICFMCTKFLQCIYGKCTDVQTDHRPLESILRKPIVKASLLLQRVMLKLQRYTLNVRYMPGRLMYVADTLSRAFVRG